MWGAHFHIYHFYLKSKCFSASLTMLSIPVKFGIRECTWLVGNTMKSNRHAPQFQFRVTDMKRRFFTKNLRWLKNFVRIFYELSCNSSKIVFDFQEPLWLRIFCCISHSNYSKDAARWMNNITGFTKKTWKIAQRWSCLSQRTNFGFVFLVIFDSFAFKVKRPQCKHSCMWFLH